MSHYAVTIVGRDRPGIISETTARLSALGVNIEDSSMTLLRGVFAFTLVCAGEVDLEEIDRSLDEIREGAELRASVHEVGERVATEQDAPRWVLTVHGADHPGIVSAITAVLAGHGGNIEDLSTRLAGGLYVLVAEVAVAADTDPQVISRELEEVAGEVGVRVSWRPSEADLL